jgi:four helix bundle protein
LWLCEIFVLVLVLVLRPRKGAIADEAGNEGRGRVGDEAVRQGMNMAEKDLADFDHEKLDVYQLELSFVAWVTEVLHAAKTAAPSFHREVCDQLDRASSSMLLNTAKGNGKRQGRQRAKFFMMHARGSAVECAACLDALVAKQIAGGIE